VVTFGLSGYWDNRRGTKSEPCSWRGDIREVRQRKVNNIPNYYKGFRRKIGSVSKFSQSAQGEGGGQKR